MSSVQCQLYLFVCYFLILLTYSQEPPTSLPSEPSSNPSLDPTPFPSSTDDTEDVAESEDSDTASCTATNMSHPLYLLDHILSDELKNYDCSNPGTYSQQQCEYYAKTECENNPSFMIFNCPKQCGFCHLLDPTIRCQRSPNAVQSVQSGDIDKTIQRIMTDFTQYSPEILHEKTPWVVLLHDVYTDEECDTMINIAGRNFKRSVDAGKMKGKESKFEEIISDARTSWNSWCVRGCWDNPIINRMAQKAENITRIPKEHSEYFQMLRYEEGQYYVQHTDYIGGHLDLPIGPRVYTYYIYLNDVEEGGETKFNKLGISVTPKRGNVVLWNNVLNENPFKMERMANHEALPVKKGIKYGANMWIHMFNFHQPFKVSCTG